MESSKSALTERLTMAFENDNDLIIECKKIARDLEEKSIQLLDIIEGLGPIITSTKIKSIFQSIKALSEILSHLPKDFLSKSELILLLTFYTERFKNDISVISPTLKGILQMIQMDNFPSELLMKLFTEMSSHIQYQTLQISERLTIFKIFHYLINNKTKELKTFENDFVIYFMSSFDGERNPKNLIFLFEMLPTFFKHFTLGQHMGEIFEIMECYFPVDYNPIAADKNNITRENLAETLSICLYAKPEFAEYCLPLIIDKLNSNLKIAKEDSLKLLRDSAPVFGIDGLKPLKDEIWSSLKDAALSSDIEIKNLSLETITKVIQVISTDTSVRDDVIKRILNDTKWTLSDVQLSSFWSSERILEAVAKANPEICKQILKFVIPICLGQYSTTTSDDEKVIILKSFCNFLTIAMEFDINIQNISELSWTDIPNLLINELNSANNELKIEVLNCFNAYRLFINATHREHLYSRMCDFIETGNELLKKTCFSCFTAFAKIYPAEIANIVTERFPLDAENVNMEILKHRLETLSVLAREFDIGHSVLPKLIEIASSKNELNTVALTCINKLLHLRNIGYDVHRFLYEQKIIDKLVTKTELPVQKLKLISSICRYIIRRLNIEEQQKLFDKYAATLKNINEDCALCFEAVIIPLHETVINSIDVYLYFDELKKLALQSQSTSTKLASCKFISVLIHKCTKTDFIERCILPLREELTNIINGNESIEIKHAAVILHSWLTKSIVIRGIPKLSNECLIDQMNLLKHSDVGKITAEEFRILIDRNEDTITEENGCTVKFLYKQRIFENLLKQNDNFEGEDRQNFLIASTIALEEIPIELLYLHIKIIVPILAESLSLRGSKLLQPVLRSLQMLLKEKHEIFAENVQNIIPRILELLSHKEMNIRIAAAECINNYCDYPSQAVYSFKSDILDKLGTSIDDHKRLVRKVAVIARSRWYLYEQPMP